MQPDWEKLSAAFVRYRRGDSAATEAVFAGIARPLERYFAVRTGSDEDARDLAQATLLKIHFARDRFDPARSLKTWVFTIASRILIDVWRGSKERATIGEAVEPDDVAIDLPNHAELLEYSDALAQALAQLKPLDRSVVYLCGVEQMSIAEVAQAVDLTESAVKTRAHRAYARLRELLREEETDGRA